MGKSKRARYLILVLVVMIVFGAMVIPVVAAVIQKQITVVTGVNIYMDDTKLNPTDVNGNPVEAFIYNGTTYLPVRAIANAVGKPVFWNEKTRNVYLGEHYSEEPDIGQISGINTGTETGKGFKYIYKVDSPFEKRSDIHERRDSVLEPQNYNWSMVRKSYLIDNDDGTFYIVDAYSNDNIIILTYDLNFNLIGTKKIKMELEEFGAFYKGEDGYYVIFGQDNLEEDDNKEVYRIVKYFFDFKRIGAVSIKGGESCTVEPFRAGTPRMAQKGNNLIVYTSRIRYTAEDGLNHQSNITIKINTDAMKITHVSTPFPQNHVSHSFNQFVLFDKDTPVYVDHSDSFPRRAIVLAKELSEERYDRNDLMYFKGESGENVTGVSLGGFEISDSKYIVAGNSVMQNEDYLDNKIRNIFITAVSREYVASHKTELIWITHHSESSDTNVFEPKLVKTNNKSFVLLWQEYKRGGVSWWREATYKNSEIKYVHLDENGYPVSGVKTLGQGILPVCDPIIIEDNLIWYAVDNDYIYFYKVSLDEIIAKEPSKSATNKMDIKKGNNIIAGTLYAMVLKEDGTLWAAGDNEYGQLGNGTNKDSNIPVQVKGLDKVARVSAGDSDAVALKSDGTVWEWGQINGSNIPVQVKGLNKVVGISTSTSHTVALKEDGTVWSWGENTFGQLGDRTNEKSNIPIQAKGVDNVKKVVAGVSYTMILKNDGTVWAWGANYSGQLGDGTNIDKDLLIKVKGLENTVDILSGDCCNMALKEDGTVWTWGSNTLGELGDGTKEDSNIPIQVRGLSNITAISTLFGSGQSAALDKEGNVWTWGLSSRSTRDDYTRPMMVKGLDKVKAISVGFNILMVVREDGSIWALGNNITGQYGIGNNKVYLEPIKIFTKLK